MTNNPFEGRYYVPIELDGKRIVPFVYVSAAIADYCLELTCENRPMTSFREDAHALINQVIVYAERQGYRVAELASPEGVEALKAIADACAAPYLPGRIQNCGDAFNAPWKRVGMEARGRARDAAMLLRGNRFRARRDRARDQKTPE